MKIITNVAGRIVEERVHMPKCFTLERTNILCQKQGWSIETVY
jgi:hypothetical protein